MTDERFFMKTATPGRPRRLGLLLALLIVTVAVRWAAAVEPPVSEGATIKIMGSYEEGVDKLWNPSLGQYAPHCWTMSNNQPMYTYTPADVAQNIIWWKELNYAWTPAAADNVNWWHTLSPKTSAGVGGYTDCQYKLFLDSLSNYDDWRNYTHLKVKWMGARSNQTASNLQVFVWTMATSRWVDLGYLVANDGVVREDLLPLTPLTTAEKQQMGYILFRVFNNDLPVSNDYNNWQRTHLYSAKVMTYTPPSMSESRGGYTSSSKYLGSVLHRRYGTYSACGFWDNSVGKYKIWMGGGIPEAGACDNVWYVETSSMEPGLERANPTRVVLNDANGILYPAAGPQYGYGGDPSVVKFEGDPNPDLYFMYFSGLQVGTSWNQIYRAYSNDGITFSLNPQTPVIASGPGVGYGTGCPSVVFKDGTYYLYHYSQAVYPNRGTVFRETSTNGTTFSGRTEVVMTGFTNTSAMDVKYVDSLGKWVCATEIEPIGTYIGISSDGINFELGNIAQAPIQYHNSNPGIIAGDTLGHVLADMYVTYGVSEKPYSLTEYYTRQLEYSSWHLR